MKAKPAKRILIKKCDKLFSEIVRSQGVCDRCGSTRNVQCCHIVSRRHLHTRWDLENAIPLCSGCHLFWAHKNPHEFVRWFDDKFGGHLYEELKKRANNTDKIDYEQTYNFLKEVRERI
jgi:5-methylcytosine-specific restriction endonuclease McrA